MVLNAIGNVLDLAQMGEMAPILQGALGAATSAQSELALFQDALTNDGKEEAHRALSQILQAEGAGLYQHLFAPKSLKLYQSLALQLRAAENHPATILKLLQPYGVFSAVVLERLSEGLEGEGGGRTRVFITQLGRLFSNSQFENFSDVVLGGEGTEDIVIRRYVAREGWELVRSVDRPMIVTSSEAILFRLLEEGGFIGSGEAGATPAMLVRMPVDPMGDPLLPEAGDLMVAGAAGLVNQELSVMNYALLRRVLFTRMAREEFEEAAGLLVTLTDPYVLSRLFSDLRHPGSKHLGLPNEKTFFALSFDYAGLTLGAMSPAEAAQLITVLAERARSEKKEMELLRWEDSPLCRGACAYRTRSPSSFLPSILCRTRFAS